MSKKIALIQVWFGPFPSYFYTHLKTCNNQNQNINFFIFTDQNIKTSYPNVKIHYINKEVYKKVIYDKTAIVADISENRKLCDYKVLAAHLFEGYLSEYDYVGFYDIDCIFGDMYDMLLPHLDKDIISIGDDTYFTGIRGPFTIWKNTAFYNQYYKNIPNYKSLLEDKEYKAIDEHQINGCLIKDKIQITSFSELINMRKNGRYIGEAVLKGKKLYIQDRESLLSHFYYKKDLGIQDGTLFYNKKVLLEDFLDVDADLFKELSVSPNPATDFIAIENVAGLAYQITDLSGKVLLTGTTQMQNQIHISDLNAGIYNIRFEKDGAVKAIKVIKM